ncbi:EpsG family protein [Tenacibaculum singaporense]|uniref:EpsG family protein n=1 Tax=Tenacibaculum singaporense TaxID=2358479 RepID=UPI00351111F3
MEVFYTGYYIIYGVLTIIIILDSLGSFFNKRMLYVRYQDLIMLLFLSTYYILLSTRSIDVGTDTENYHYLYESMYKYENYLSNTDIGFYLYNKLLIYIGVMPEIYLFFISLLFVVPVYFAVKEFKNTNRVFLLWFFASLFIFVTMSTNILRQGIGGVFAMWGISLYLNRVGNSKKFMIPLLIAPFFHISLLLVILMFFISKKIKNIKVVHIVLLVSIILSYLNFNLNSTLGNLPVVGEMFMDRVGGYLGENFKNYKVGFRLDFLIFNLFFVFFGYYLLKFKKIEQKFPLYRRVYVMYVLLTAYFTIMFNIPFSDRFGVLSWGLIPFIMYPLYSLSNFNNNNIKLMSVVLGLSLFIIFNVIMVE